MKTRFAFVLGAGLGYVFGTRAGRENYDKLATKVQDAWVHPRVQEQVRSAETKLNEVVSEHIPHLVTKARGAARDAMGMEFPEQ